MSKILPYESGITSVPLLFALVPGATTLTAMRDEEIASQGERAEHCYLVLSGCVRVVALLEDGRRQVSEFLLPNDIFGLEAAGEYAASAEALSDMVTLLRLPLRPLSLLAHQNPDLAHALIETSMGKLRAIQERTLLLGRKTAIERIASFLLEMASRLSIDHEGRIALFMSRTDIADHLGLTAETLCRGLTQLRRAGAIAIERSNVAILDHATLRAAACEAVH